MLPGKRKQNNTYPTNREAADRVLVPRLHARVGAGRGDHEHELHGRRLRG